MRFHETHHSVVHQEMSAPYKNINILLFLYGGMALRTKHSPSECFSRHYIINCFVLKHIAGTFKCHPHRLALYHFYAENPESPLLLTLKTALPDSRLAPCRHSCLSLAYHTSQISPAGKLFPRPHFVSFDKKQDCVSLSPGPGGIALIFSIASTAKVSQRSL